MLGSFVVALAIGTQAYTGSPMKVSRVAATHSARQTVVMGTFVEELKFKRFFNRFTFKTFSDAVVAAGLEDELAKNKYTLFVPTDAAFEEFGAAALETLMADKAKLAEVVKMHMMAGTVEGNSFRWLESNGKKMKTLQGKEFPIDSDGKSAYFGDAKILTYDVETDQGIFHILDYVLS
jgi:uncharacterized surface protein with fasciclin (FAS1) repeats